MNDFPIHEGEESLGKDLWSHLRKRPDDDKEEQRINNMDNSIVAQLGRLRQQGLIQREWSLKGWETDWVARELQTCEEDHLWDGRMIFKTI